MAFGFGPHRCPGASVVRSEVAVALQALLENLADIRPHPVAAAHLGSECDTGGYKSCRCTLRLIPDPGTKDAAARA